MVHSTVHFDKSVWRKATLTFFIVATFFTQTNALVYVPAVSPVVFGGSTTLFCNLTGETLTSFSWFSYNGSQSTLLNLGNVNSASVPPRYTISVFLRNGSTTILSYSTLTITNVTNDDYTTFECRASASAKVNLTQLVIVTTTIAPVRCLLDNYNYALYIMIMLSNAALIVAIVALYQFISDPTNFQLLLLFGAVLSSVILVIVMILFWISPDFVSGSSQVWSPTVIIPCGYAGLIILWIAFLVYLAMIYKWESIIEIPVLVIVAVVCAIQLICIAAIFVGISYCTDTTTLARYTSDPQIVNVALGGVILFLCLVIVALVFWKHKGKKKIISIQSANYNNVRDHSFLSGFFGIRSEPSANLSPTSIKNGREEIQKGTKNALPLLPVPASKPEKEKEKEKEKDKKDKAKDGDKKEKEKEKDKGKKEDEKKKSLKLPDLQAATKSPESSFGSMDFDQNDLRRSTPNAEDVETAPKTVNPLLMNFIKNTNDQKNLEAIREETPEGKNKNTPKTTPKVTPKTTKPGAKEDTSGKDSSRKEKDKKDSKKSDDKGSKKKVEKKEDDEPILNDDGDSLNGDRGSNAENLFSIEPLTDRKNDEEDKKKAKKAGKGKTKPKE